MLTSITIYWFYHSYLIKFLICYNHWLLKIRWSPTETQICATESGQYEWTAKPPFIGQVATVSGAYRMTVIMDSDVCYIFHCLILFTYVWVGAFGSTHWYRLYLELWCYLYFRYGQLSGLVEPIAGLFGTIAVVIAEPILPYALAFAAGAMIYVVVDDIIPEAQTWYVTWTFYCNLCTFLCSLLY